MSLSLKSYHALPNLDTTVDTRYPLGNKTQVQPATLGIDLAAFNAASINLLNLPQSFAVTYNYRQFLTGTSASSATFTVNAITGSLVNWQVDPSGNGITSSTAAAGSGALQVVAFDTAGNVVNFPIQNWSVLAPAQQGQVRLVAGHMGASGGTCTGSDVFAKFKPEITDMLKDDWIIGYRLFISWGHMDMGPCTFSSSSTTGGTLTVAPQKSDNAYFCKFNNGEFRQIQVAGTSATWSAALSASPASGHLYYFQVVDDILAYYKTQFTKLKYLVLTVIPQSFAGGTRSTTDYSIVPKYIATNSAYGSSPDPSSYGWWGPPMPNWSAGTTYSVNQLVTYTDRHQYRCRQTALGAGQAPGGSGNAFWADLNGAYTAAVYRPAVAAQYALMGEALGAKYDSNPSMYAIMDQETSAVVNPAINYPPRDGSYSDANYSAQLINTVYPVWIAACPHVNVVIENSFLQTATPTQNLENTAMNLRMAIGNSDTLGLAYHQANPGAIGRNWGIEAWAGQVATGSTATVSDRRGQIACMIDVEGPDIRSTVNSSNVGTTPKDMCDSLNQVYKAHNAFWCYIPQDPAVTWRGTGTHLVNGVAVPNLPVTTVLRDNPLTANFKPVNYP